FIGSHEFTGFCPQKTEVKRKVRTLYQSENVKADEGFDCIVTGTRFLNNRVRVLVAFLIEVGKRRKEVSDVQKRLESKKRKNV
ncbi:pseudouridine synthase, partial [Staphylococcus aureus]